MKQQTICIIGIGLIGGSLAITLKENGFAQQIIGVDKCQQNIEKAIRRRLIDQALPLEEALPLADIIIVATPVDSIGLLLPNILDKTTDKQTVIDVASSKEKLHQIIENHPKRGRFVSTHPMAGTEYSGPEAAIPHLFDHKTCVFCEATKSDRDAFQVATALYQSIPMHITHLTPSEHDIHTAYVSHISHISSFALALTVLEKEKDEKQIFELASGGFSSTVRLAKSSPDMWVPIFRQNKQNVLDVLEEHIHQLSHFKEVLEADKYDDFYQLIERSNEIKRIIQ